MHGGEGTEKRNKTVIRLKDLVLYNDIVEKDQ